jgi:hypothetical protein
LIDEPAGNRQEGLRIRRENAGGGGGALDHAQAAVEGGQGFAVCRVDERRCGKCARDLRDRIGHDLAPRERPVHGQRDGDGGIQVRPRHARRCVDAEHHGETPADVDREDRAVGVLAEDGLGDHADAECNQDKGAEEFRGGFPRCAFEHARF